ncbi:hypothetical protein [Microbacterium aurantiacum]|nr:hypothetical protein [Microbacterium aurantiacum]
MSFVVGRRIVGMPALLDAYLDRIVTTVGPPIQQLLTREDEATA